MMDVENESKMGVKKINIDYLGQYFSGVNGINLKN